MAVALVNGCDLESVLLAGLEEVMLARASDVELGEVASVLTQHEILSFFRSLTISALQKGCQALDAQWERKARGGERHSLPLKCSLRFPFRRVSVAAS